MAAILKLSRIVEPTGNYLNTQNNANLYNLLDRVKLSPYMLTLPQHVHADSKLVSIYIDLLLHIVSW